MVMIKAVSELVALSSLWIKTREHVNPFDNFSATHSEGRVVCGSRFETLLEAQLRADGLLLICKGDCYAKQEKEWWAQI
jgi:hypothetical protein